MQIFGLTITRARPPSRELVPLTDEQKALHQISADRGGWGLGSFGWLPVVRDWFPGAWQRNQEIDARKVGAFHADFACKTLISQDFAKLRCRLIEEQGKIWVETKNSAYDPVLRRPNHFQNAVQFWESWILSKLSNGNTYVLLQRDERKVVKAMYVLDYTRCHPLVADDGALFYRLSSDYLGGIDSDVIVPARDIIHDRMNTLFHPLCGLPPIFASGLAAQQGLNIQSNQLRFFENNSAPGGILSAPGEISEADVNRMRAEWEQKYQGPRNYGRIAVLGSGLKFEKMALTAVEGQLIEQLKWTAEVVCSTYHVPPYKVGVGVLPSYNNVQALNVEYYSQCLQYHIEAAERCLENGLGMANDVGVEFDLEGLLRMDSNARITMLREAVAAGILSPNEARAVIGYGPVTGGESPMVQQQNYSLEALAKRDAKPDPFASATAAPTNGGSSSVDDDDEDENASEERAAAAQIAAWKLKDLLVARRARTA